MGPWTPDICAEPRQEVPLVAEKGGLEWVLSVSRIVTTNASGTGWGGAPRFPDGTRYLGERGRKEVLELEGSALSVFLGKTLTDPWITKFFLKP